MIEINFLKPRFTQRDMQQMKRIRAVQQAKENPNLSVCKSLKCSNVFYNSYEKVYLRATRRGLDFYEREGDDPSRKKKLCPDCIARNYNTRVENEPELYAPPRAYHYILRDGFALINSSDVRDVPEPGVRVAFTATVSDITGRPYQTVFV